MYEELKSIAERSNHALTCQFKTDDKIFIYISKDADSEEVIKSLIRLTLEDAILTGENQIFLSVSCMQSEAIRHHVINFASSLEIGLTGDRVVLPNGAEFIFLLTDSQVMGGYSGNAYAINCFDDTNFNNINSLISVWAMFKKHRAVFISTELNDNGVKND
jgi:hypothetical protein